MAGCGAYDPVLEQRVDLLVGHAELTQQLGVVLAQ
jgi:hypothetical protein